jgi:hypothetical protein
LAAIRTNYATIAERVYWGIQTKDFALSKGITLEYYNLCQQLWVKLRNVFVNVLKGDESALRKAILNGRAAKKVAIQLQKRGMRGLEELNGLSGMSGLGSLGSVAASIASAQAFLAPIVAFLSRFKNVLPFAKKAAAGAKVFVAKRRSK